MSTTQTQQRISLTDNERRGQLNRSIEILENNNYSIDSLRFTLYQLSDVKVIIMVICIFIYKVIVSVFKLVKGPVVYVKPIN